MWRRIVRRRRGAGEAAEESADHGARVGREASEEASELVARKAREYPEAMIEARAIAESHDAVNAPVRVLMVALNALKRRFRWIKRFGLTRRGPGRFRIWFEASPKHTVDDDYTDGERSSHTGREAAEETTGSTANAAKERMDDLIKVNKPDPAADALAERIGGQSTVRFPDVPNEFDVINLERKIIGQTTDRTILGSKFRTQAKTTFETAQGRGMSVTYEFTRKPSSDLIKKLTQYSREYNVKLDIIHNY